MNQIFKVARSAPMLNATRNIFTTSQRNFVGIWSMRREFDLPQSNVICKPQIPSITTIAMQHTKGERELVEFLAEEIVAEQKAQKLKKLPSDVDGFAVKVDGAEVELTKTVGSDKVTIKFNINHTVDQDGEPEISSQEDETVEMKSKPEFEVDVKRGSTTLSFTCNFLDGEAQEGEYNDAFGINEITIYEGEHSEKVYAVAGEVLDGYLYDLLMNFLEEKGISNAFAEKLVEFSTGYEHQNYIKFLDALSKFTTGK